MKNKLLSLVFIGATTLSFGNCVSKTEKAVLGNSFTTCTTFNLATGMLAPETPEALSAVNVRNTTLGAQWTAVPGATGYLLDVSSTPFSGIGEDDDAMYVYQNLNVGNVTFYTVTNLMADTPYYYRVRATDGQTTSDYSNIISAITASVSSWNGTTWSDNEPQANINAIIEAPYDNILNGNFTARTLTVNGNGKMIVRSGTNFTVLRGITNNADSTAVTIENNANLLQTGSLNENSGAITVARNAQMKRLDYVYWSSPVEGQNLSDFSKQTLTERFYRLDETSNTFAYVDPLQNDFTPAKGFSIRAPNNFTTTAQTFTGIFKGKPNNGTISIPLSSDGHGFNLIGNPYPSTITTNLFLAENPAINTLYFFTHTVSGPTNGRNYATYNATGQIEASATGSAMPNETIQTGQGFIAQVDQAGDAVFLNSMRVANNEDQFFRNAPVEKHRIWLDLGNASGRINQILIGYVEGATNGTDKQFDGKPMTSPTTGINSISSDNGVFAIQGKALPFSDSDTVKLSFTTEAPGNYTISSPKHDGLFAEQQAFYLRDNATGIITNLKEADYTFASEAGKFNDRFEVIYQNTTLSVNPIAAENTIVVFNENGVLKIDSGNTLLQTVKIYDISGRLLYQNTDVNSKLHIAEGFQSRKTAMIVQIGTEDGLTVSKKIIY